MVPLHILSLLPCFTRTLAAPTSREHQALLNGLPSPPTTNASEPSIPYALLPPFTAEGEPPYPTHSSLHVQVPLSTHAHTPQPPHPHYQTQVLILGGGMAGLTAAHALAERNIHNYTIVEAQPYLGGRLLSVPFGASPHTGEPYVVEAGANWVHGVRNNETGVVNPVWELVSRFGLQASRSEDGVPRAFDSVRGRTFPGTSKASADIDAEDTMQLDQLAEADTDDPVEQAVRLAWSDWQLAWNRFLTLGRERQRRGLGDMTARAGLRIAGWEARDYVRRSVEFWNFDMESQQSPEESSWFEIANNHWHTYQGFSDEEFLVHDPRGFVTVATGPYFSLPAEKQGTLLLGRPVKELHYSKTGMEAVLEGGGRVTAEYAVCTFSVGVLQSKAVTFHPALPRWKADAIDGFSMSTYTKIFLQFSRKFWPTDSEYQLHAHPRRGFYTQFQSLDYPGILEGSGIMFTTLTDEESVRVEGMSDEEVKEEVLDVLKGMYGEENVSEVVAFYFHRWNSNPYTRGSYSNWPASYLPAAQSNLRAALSARLLFAGEATSYEYLGYLQGAYTEGLKAAASVANCLERDGEKGCLGQDWYEDILAGQGGRRQWQKREVLSE